VQGVGFRWFVEREARAIGVAGWVKNNEDSTVEVLAVADEAKQAALLARLQEGPRASRVDQVVTAEAGPEETTGHMKDFQIIGAW
jgi:acylphosphatase